MLRAGRRGYDFRREAIRINANTSSAECAGTKTDCNGDVWLGDFGFNTGGNNTCNLNGGGEACVISGIPALFGCEDETTEDSFQCERWDADDRAGAPVQLQRVPNGAYLLNLFFANTYTGTTTGGSRIFDIQLEGATVYNDFDQIAAAGGSGIAVVRSAIASVSDGNGLQIQLLTPSRIRRSKPSKCSPRYPPARPTPSATMATSATAPKPATRPSAASPAPR